MIIFVKHLKARRIDAAACNRARAILRIRNGIVPAERVVDPRILHRTAARVHIRCKRRTCSIAKTAGNAREIDIPRIVAVRAKHSVARRAVAHTAQRGLCVGRRPVVDFRCGSERERHGTRRDRTAPRQRRRPRHGLRVERRIEGIVIRLVCIRNRKCDVISHVLRCGNTARIGDVL